MFRPRRLHICACALTLGSALAACIDTTTPTTSAPNPPYAVLYGHVTTSNNATDVQVFGQAYLDSANALDRDSLFGGFNNAAVNDSGDYFTVVNDLVPRKVYFNVEAVSSRPAGVDSIYAVPVRLDSVGGGPHDSIQINFTVP